MGSAGNGGEGLGFPWLLGSAGAGFRGWACRLGV